MQLIQICLLRLNYIYQDLTLLVIFSIYIPLLIFIVDFLSIFCRFSVDSLSILCRLIDFLVGYVVRFSSLKSMLLVDFCDERDN